MPRAKPHVFDLPHRKMIRSKPLNSWRIVAPQERNLMSSVLVVGTVALDSVETPTETRLRVLGGSATYFSYAASFFTKVSLVGVVGEDFPSEYRELLARRGVDLAGLTTQPGGKTFYWRGRYHENMNDRETAEVHLNVIADYQPILPRAYRAIPYVFLANSSPVTHLKVLEQMERPQLVMADTMDLWIETQRDELLTLLPRLDGLVLNDAESRLLSGEQNLIRAGKAVHALGPRFVIIKKGEHGSFLFSKDGVFILPGYPTENVVDPTGAGDTYAGGIMGAYAEDPRPGPGRLRRAIAYGTVVASLTVEDFSLERLKRTNRAEIDARLTDYRRMLEF
jgi:sugar/nucleoside kinase (ribokinase family)